MEKIKESIIDLFQKNSDYCFAELISELDNMGLPVKGTRALYAAKNLIIWKDTSSEFNNAILELQREKKIELQPLSLTKAMLVYSYSGEMPDMPIAKPNDVYETPHWVPMIVKAL